MKLFLITLSLCSVVVTAETSPPACVTYIPCGTYEGNGAWFDLNGHPTKNGAYLEKTVISPVDDHTIALEEYVYDKTQKPEDGYALKAHFIFQSNGQYNAVLPNSQIFATGACSDSVCTFTFLPWKNKDSSVTGNVNILRFEGQQLKRLMLVSRSLKDNKTAIQKSNLVKNKPAEEL